MLEAVLADSQGKPEIGAAEVTKMARPASTASSPATPPPSRSPRRRKRPRPTRRMWSMSASPTRSSARPGQHVPLRPGYGKIADFAVDNLDTINKAVRLSGEDGDDHPRGIAVRHRHRRSAPEKLPEKGIEVVEVIKHANPTRDFTNIVLQIKAKKPDLIIPANYYNEYVLLARTMRQQRVEAKGIYSVLGGAASNYKFVKEFPEAANTSWIATTGSIRSRTWRSQRKAAAEAKGLIYTYEVFLAYNAVASWPMPSSAPARPTRMRSIAALAASTWTCPTCPMARRRWSTARTRAASRSTPRCSNGDIEVIFPEEFASPSRSSR
jgi:branched-chain amino acid transport system substrate-binding protein